MRRKYAFRDGEMVDITPEAEPTTASKGLTVISDELKAPIKSPINGRVYESRSRYNRHVEESGYVFKADCKKGTKPKQIQSTPEDYEREVAKAIEQCRYGNSGLTEYERHVCKEMDRRIKNHG